MIAMFRYAAARLHRALNHATAANEPPASVRRRQMSKRVAESDAQFDARYERYFNRVDIDGWEIRQAVNDLCGHDMVPEPCVVAAALRACRRVNDYAMAVRVLEAVREKCGPRRRELYPWFIGEICQTLDELGIDTPEELGYGEPELALPGPYDT